MTTIPRLRLAGPGDRPVLPPPGLVLSRAESLRLDQAELFLLSLNAEMLTADMPRAAYLLGMAEAHLADTIEILRAVLA